MDSDIGWVTSYHTFAVYFINLLILYLGKRSWEWRRSLGRVDHVGRVGGFLLFLFFLA